MTLQQLWTRSFPPYDRLALFAYGTFHALLLLVLNLLIVHPMGLLGPVFGPVGTPLATLSFGSLWLLAVLVTAGAIVDPRGGPAGTDALLEQLGRRGGIFGMLYQLGAVTILALALAEGSPDLAVFVLIVGCLSFPLAFLGGALAGVILALFDQLARELADAFEPSAPSTARVLGPPRP